jgi:hypothetical protein
VFASAFAGAELLEFASVFATGVSALAFVSVLAGTVSDGVSETDSSTETPPCNAGIEIKKAETIKTVAAMIVILESTDAVPRGPNAALDTLLVNNAPASVFPGCSSTDPTSTMHAIKNSA